MVELEELVKRGLHQVGYRFHLVILVVGEAALTLECTKNAAIASEIVRKIPHRCVCGTHEDPSERVSTPFQDFIPSLRLWAVEVDREFWRRRTADPFCNARTLVGIGCGMSRLPMRNRAHI